MTDQELGFLLALVGVGGVVLGGIVAGAFALLTGWLDNRREHKRWLREERFKVIAQYGEIATLAALKSFQPKDEDERRDLQHQFSDVLSRINILADQRFRDETEPSLVFAHMGAAGQHAPGEQVEDALIAYYKAAKVLLGIK